MATLRELDEVKKKVGQGRYDEWQRRAHLVYDQAMKDAKHSEGRILMCEPRSAFVGNFIKIKYLENLLGLEEGTVDVDESSTASR